MIQNKFGQIIYTEQEIFDLVMQGISIDTFSGMSVDETVDVDIVNQIAKIKLKSVRQHDHDCSVEQFHQNQQKNWHMPQDYKNLDIAAHVLNLCVTQEELQRCGKELLLYQEKNLFDLLRYLKYLVDVMKHNQIIWGVGRGSSVASYVLYKLGVHRIDSMYYNLDVEEFLR